MLGPPQIICPFIAAILLQILVYVWTKPWCLPSCLLPLFESIYISVQTASPFILFLVNLLSLLFSSYGLTFILHYTFSVFLV